MGMTLRGIMVGLVLVAPVFAGLDAAPARGAPVPAAPVRAAPSGTDQEIVSQLHLASQLALEAADLGKARASRSDVIQLATSMAEDQRVADLSVLNYADLKQMDMGFVGRPGAAIPAHDALALADLEQTSMAAFDHAFLTKVVANEQAFIDEAESARAIAHDPALRAMIDGLLATGRAQLAEAQTILAGVPEPTPPAPVR